MFNKMQKRKKDEAARNARRYTEELHDEWVWSLTNPLEKGIQKNWEYQCAYCGAIFMGNTFIDSGSLTCSECGAPLIEPDDK